MPDILALSALVAAYVGVIRSFGVPAKWIHPLALLVASFFVLLPPVFREQAILISMVGLSATGAYHYAKQKGDGPRV